MPCRLRTKSTMDKKDLLLARANVFHDALEKYSKNDSDVADFLERFIPWYEMIKRFEISPPCYDYQLDKYFINSDLSPLAEKYFYPNSGNHELTIRGGEFWAAIRDMPARNGSAQEVAPLV